MKSNINLKNEVIIKLSDNDINKIENIILQGNNIFKKRLEEIKQEELLSGKKYNFTIEKNITLKHQKIVSDIIKFVINNYKRELNELELVFLACSFGRQTNKIESDLDLHFIYKNNSYKKEYEEIVCYIITKILDKNRDDIDPKMIINFNIDLKKQYESIVTNENLKIILKSEQKEIVYYYNSNKKKKFFLQYNNSKKIEDLQKYILENGILEYNLPWSHSYDIIYGNNVFEEMYFKIYETEKNILNDIYFNKQKKLLIKEINSINLDISSKHIAKIKKKFQSNVFSAFYKYLNIIRIYYIKKGQDIKFLKIYELYDNVDYEFKKIIENILIYIWEIKKLSIYCNCNEINYSIHKNDVITNYDLKNLNNIFILIKKEILNSLKEMK